MRSLDLAEVVLVVAGATGVDPAVVIDEADVGVLVGITGRARTAPTLGEAAAELLVGFAASRPLPAGNRVAAWCLAAHLVALNGARLVATPEVAVSLVDRAAAGEVDERDAACELESCIESRPAAWRVAIDWLGRPVAPAAQASSWGCPVCERPVLVAPGRSTVFRVAPQAREVVHDCSVQHRAHGPDGHVVVDDVDGADAADELDHRIRMLRVEQSLRSVVVVPA